jgi:hypothetical protein
VLSNVLQVKLSLLKSIPSTYISVGRGAESFLERKPLLVTFVSDMIVGVATTYPRGIANQQLCVKKWKRHKDAFLLGVAVTGREYLFDIESTVGSRYFLTALNLPER